jgi:hypothetical protein
MQVQLENHCGRRMLNGSTIESTHPGFWVCDGAASNMVPDALSGEGGKEGKGNCVLQYIGQLQGAVPGAPPAAKAAFDARMHDPQLEHTAQPEAAAGGTDAGARSLNAQDSVCKDRGSAKKLNGITNWDGDSGTMRQDAAGMQDCIHAGGQPDERMMPTPYMVVPQMQSRAGPVMLAVHPCMKRSACAAVGSLQQKSDQWKILRGPVSPNSCVMISAQHGMLMQMPASMQHSKPKDAVNPVATAAEYLMGMVPCIRGKQSSAQNATSSAARLPSCASPELGQSLNSTGLFDGGDGNYLMSIQDSDFEFDLFRDSPFIEATEQCTTGNSW